MFSLTKTEVTFILDTVSDLQSLLSSTHVEFDEELDEVVNILQCTLDFKGGEDDK